MKPTDEQIKRLWETCGLRWFWNHNPECRCGAVDDDSKRSWHFLKDGEWHLATRFWHEDMSIDSLEYLGILFKYAVPKVVVKICFEQECSIQLAYAILFKRWLQKLEDDFTKPEIALFWACYKAFGLEE